MSSSSSIEREIDEYQDVSSGSEGSEDSVDSSSCSNSSDDHYSSGVLGIPLEEFQELQRRMAAGSGLARPDSHLVPLKTRKRTRKI